MEPISTAVVLGSYYTFKELAKAGKEIKDASPQIAESAKTLWRKVSGKGATELRSPADAESTSDIKAGLHTSSAVDGVALIDIQTQVRASLEITNALAEQSLRFADFVEVTRQQFEVVEKQSHQLIARLEADGLAIQVLEKQNSLLIKKIDTYSELLKSLEAQNVQFAKEVEVERSRTSRLTGMCIAIGLIAVAGLVMAVRTAMQ